MFSIQEGIPPRERVSITFEVFAAPTFFNFYSLHISLFNNIDKKPINAFSNLPTVYELRFH
jgi:hypothetical protein